MRTTASATLAVDDLCGGGETPLPLTQKTGKERHQKKPRGLCDCHMKSPCTLNPPGLEAHERVKTIVRRRKRKHINKKYIYIFTNKVKRLPH